MSAGTPLAASPSLTPAPSQASASILSTPAASQKSMPLFGACGTAMATTFAEYLASLDQHHRKEHFVPGAEDAMDAAALEQSPLKRPRADSPEASVTSSAAASTSSFFLYESAKTISAATSACVLRSILTPTPSSPLSSPPISRSLSRRSSTSNASGTSKSVRFARCTNASVFPCLSASDYDRSSIVPTCESESLELPRRKRSEAEGWIKCVERERAAAAKKQGVSIVAGQMAGPSGPCTTFTPAPLPVEGVHGLIQGGYFVGDERDGDGGMDGYGEDTLMTDDGLTTDEEIAPVLIRDDTSSGSAEDSDELGSILSADVVIGGTTPLQLESHKGLRLVIPSPEPRAPVALSSFGSARTPSSITSDSDEEDNDQDEFHPEDLDHHDDSGHARDDEGGAASSDDEEEIRTKTDRYGLCALGKYTRAEVFSSHDSFGGF